MEEPYLYDRDTYEEIRESVERMYDQHAAHPEIYHNVFVDFDGETNRVIYEMAISDELEEYLLCIALAVSAINRERPLPQKVKAHIEKILTSDVLQQHFDELLSSEKIRIRSDLNHIVDYIRK